MTFQQQLTEAREASDRIYYNMDGPEESGELSDMRKLHTFLSRPDLASAPEIQEKVIGEVVEVLSEMESDIIPMSVERSRGWNSACIEGARRIRSLAEEEANYPESDKQCNHSKAIRELGEKVGRKEGGSFDCPHCSFSITTRFPEPEQPEDSMTGKEKAILTDDDPLIQHYEARERKLKEALRDCNEEACEYALSLLDEIRELRSNPLRPGLERAVEAIKDVAQMYLDGGDYDAGAQDALNNVRQALRSELEPEKELGWEDVPIQGTFTVQHMAGGEYRAFKYKEHSAAVGLHGSYDSERFHNSPFTILSIDGKAEGEG